MNRIGLTLFRANKMHLIMNLLGLSSVMKLGVSFSYDMRCTRMSILGISIQNMGEPSLGLDSGTELGRLAEIGGAFETIC